MKSFFEDKDYALTLKNNKERDRMYSRFNEKQKAFFRSIQDNIFTFCEASTGTGKTTVATAALLDLLANGEINKIVYIRVADARVQSLGYLPGDIDEKMAPYWGPFYEALITLGLQTESIRAMESLGLLKETLDITLRGTNLEKCGVIIDEVQNANIETLGLIFTRFHDNLHAVAIGDGIQRDQKKASTSFRLFCNLLASSSMGNKCELDTDYRGKFSRLAEKIMKELIENDEHN
jgi:phosphate starvation-inducible protein PhoH